MAETENSKVRPFFSVRLQQGPTLEHYTTSLNGATIWRENVLTLEPVGDPSVQTTMLRVDVGASSVRMTLLLPGGFLALVARVSLPWLS